MVSNLGMVTAGSRSGETTNHFLEVTLKRPLTLVWDWTVMTTEMKQGQTKFLHRVIVGCQSDQMASGNAENQLSPNLSPNIRILFEQG